MNRLAVLACLLGAVSCAQRYNRAGLSHALLQDAPAVERMAKEEVLVRAIDTPRLAAVKSFALVSVTAKSHSAGAFAGPGFEIVESEATLAALRGMSKDTLALAGVHASRAAEQLLGWKTIPFEQVLDHEKILALQEPGYTGRRLNLDRDGARAAEACRVLGVDVVGCLRVILRAEIAGSVYSVNELCIQGPGGAVLLRALRQRLPKERFRLTYCHNATLGRRDFYRQLCLALGLSPKATAASVFYAIATEVQQLAEARVHPVFFLDEAHLLHPDVLGHLHILLNYEWDSKALLSVVLVGLPETEDRLALGAHKPLLTPPCTRAVRIEPVSADDSAEYPAPLRKWIGNDLFPFGVVAIDGKAAWSGHYAAHPSCRRSTQEGRRDDYVLMPQRASLVSSSARPCVTQTIIAHDAGEADTFARTFGFLLRHFGRSFEFVTHDSGGTSRENAALVHAAEEGVRLCNQGEPAAGAPGGEVAAEVQRGGEGQRARRRAPHGRTRRGRGEHARDLPLQCGRTPSADRVRGREAAVARAADDEADAPGQDGGEGGRGPLLHHQPRAPGGAGTPTRAVALGHGERAQLGLRRGAGRGARSAVRDRQRHRGDELAAAARLQPREPVEAPAPAGSRRDRRYVGARRPVGRCTGRSGRSPAFPTTRRANCEVKARGRLSKPASRPCRR